MNGCTNLRPVRPSRKKPKPGDIFAMLLPDDRYLWGRVILADIPMGRAPMPGVYLIYVYRDRTEEMVPPYELLTAERLLLPPTYINRMPWSRGFFETVSHRDLKLADLLAHHCFRGYGGHYYDETGERLSASTEPCGQWSLISYRGLGDEISDALGFPRVPE